ncbi:Mitochondrial inner membrane protein COX18 [Habropoda laboriosa]|uniref:Mitochondrial inner membrane protein COX18 n=1 Tax=Habropoda laboriosa TaxID=597456 RepID=A0A0L7QLX8_9HYME|nr:PREDICTED: mitochondrial inner membrane protein COX18 [Habropoda laboriosa]KOC59511.1 Mitochondrial inner membrane protein COX18 [Habropoda laboriosa]
MTVQMFKKVVLNLKCDINIFIKCCQSSHYISNVSCQNIHKNLFSDNKALVGYFSNEQNFSKRKTISSHQQAVTHKILKGSLLCSKEAVLAKKVAINHYAVTVNNIRQYGSSSPVIVNEAFKYNSGIFQIISESLPVALITDALRVVHFDVGLPWWATIVFSAVIARTFIHLPLTVYDHRTRARHENLQGELKDATRRIKMDIQMKVATNEISSKRAMLLFAKRFKEEANKLYQRENCHPFKSVAIILLQAPIWLSFSVAVRNMSYMLPERTPVTFQDYLGLTHGGFGWIQDLTDIDHLFVLPIIFTFSGLILIEINRVLYNVDDTKLRKFILYFHRAVTICFLPIMMCIPSSLNLYWATNNFCSVLQSLLLLSPKFRRFAGISKTAIELQHPYTELRKRLIGIFRWKKRSLTKT